MTTKRQLELMNRFFETTSYDVETDWRSVSLPEDELEDEGEGGSLPVELRIVNFNPLQPRDERGRFAGGGGGGGAGEEGTKAPYLSFEGDVGGAWDYYKKQTSDIKKDLFTEEGEPNETWEIIKSYQSVGYARLQDEAVRGVASKKVETIKEYIKSHPIEDDLSLVRVVNSGKENQKYLEYDVGEVFVENRFTSTSLVDTEKLGTLVTSTPEDNIVLRIKAAKGSTNVANFYNTRELEYLIDSRSSFQVEEKVGKEVTLRLL